MQEHEKDVAVTVRVKRGDISIDAEGKVIIANPKIAKALRHLSEAESRACINVCLEGPYTPVSDCSVDVRCASDVRCNIADIDCRPPINIGCKKLA